MTTRGRSNHRAGESHPKAILTDEQVRAMRARYVRVTAIKIIREHGKPMTALQVASKLEKRPQDQVAVALSNEARDPDGLLAREKVDRVFMYRLREWPAPKGKEPAAELPVEQSGKGDLPQENPRDALPAKYPQSGSPTIAAPAGGGSQPVDREPVLTGRSRPESGSVSQSADNPGRPAGAAPKIEECRAVAIADMKQRRDALRDQADKLDRAIAVLEDVL